MDFSYFEHANRFCEEGFTPSEEDCIMARVRTTGIVATEFDEGPIHFSYVLLFDIESDHL